MDRFGHGSPHRVACIQTVEKGLPHVLEESNQIRVCKILS